MSHGKHRPYSEMTPEQKASRKANAARWRAGNREKVAALQRAARERNIGHAREVARDRWQRIKDDENAKRRERRAADGEAARAADRARYLRYLEVNRARARRYYHENAEYCRAAHRAYKQRYRQRERTPEQIERDRRANTIYKRRFRAKQRAEVRTIMAEMAALEADAVATFVPDAEVLGVASARAKRRDKMHNGKTHAATVAMRQAARAARPVPVMHDETPVVYGQRRYNSFPKRAREVIEMVAERLIVQAPAEPAHNYRDAAYGRWAAHNPVHAIVKARKQGSDGRHE